MQISTIIYRLAISFWVGGAALFTFLLTPAIFRSFGRDQAGSIVGVLFPGYFRWGLACGALALISLAFHKGRPALFSVIIIAAMMIITAVQAFVIEPRATELKKSIRSFEIASDNPQRAEFRKLHGMSAAGNLAVIGGGIALVVFF